MSTVLEDERLSRKSPIDQAATLDENKLESAEKKLSPIDFALYQIFLKLKKIEAGEISLLNFFPALPEGIPWKIVIGSVVQDWLERVEFDDEDELTILGFVQDYITTQLLIYPDISYERVAELLAQLGPEVYKQMYPTLGSTDLRVGVDYNLTSINFHANLGSMDGTEKLWHFLIDDIDFPIEVNDTRYGDFHYSNAAFQKYKRV